MPTSALEDGRKSDFSEFKPGSVYGTASDVILQWRPLWKQTFNDKPVSVELSCGAGPSHVVLEPGSPLTLDCNLGASDTPLNITWLHEGRPLPPDGSDARRHVDDRSLLLLLSSEGAAPPQGLEGGYSCVSTSAHGALTSRTVNVLLASLSSFRQEPSPQTVPAGGAARFECQIDGVPTPVITWEKDKVAVPQDPSRFISLPNGVLQILEVTREDEGAYRCVASNSAGRDISHESRLTVTTGSAETLNRVMIVAPPQNATVVLGRPAVMECMAQGQPKPLVSWSRLDGKPISTDVVVLATNLVIRDTRPHHGGIYVCRANKPRTREFVIAAAELYVPGSDNVEYQFAMNNDTTEYHVKDLLPHTAYTFFVVAYSLKGASRPSLPVTIDMLEDVPSAPPQLSIASTSPTDIRLMWHPLSSQHSRGAVTSYRIEYSSLDNADTVFSVEVGGNETQFTLRELQPNQAYRLRIAAGTGVGFGVPSEWAQHQTLAHYNHTSHRMVMFAPTELKVRAQVSTLNVTWQPSPNHTAVSGYKLSCREVDADGVKTTQTHVVRLRKKARYHLFTGLVSGQQYEVRVWAFNKQADGSAAVWKGRTEKADKISSLPMRPPPLPPSSIQAAANSSTSIRLCWEKPRFSTVRIINYTVRCSPAGTTNASLVTYHTSAAQEILIGALKPFTRYELAVQSNGVDVVGPFSSTVEESTFSDRPSSPPHELRLSAIDSSSVLVSWRPPLEPNGVIVGYRILFSSNLSQPEHLWRNLSQDGSLTSVELRGLSSGTHYFFKLGASTEVGAGPYSLVKDIHTPPDQYELDIHAVTGIIVGVCLGLICILLCMCFSFRNTKTRGVSGSLDSTAVTPQYRRGGYASPAHMPECNDCHELETLMPPAGKESDQSAAEAPEELNLMAAWNGSISHNWANRITRYRDTVTDDSAGFIAGEVNVTNNTDCPSASPSSNQVEAEVIVHSELSDPVSGKAKAECGRAKDSKPTRGPSLEQTEGENPPGKRPLDQSQPILPSTSLAADQKREPEDSAAEAVRAGPKQDSGLTNGFHSPKTPRPTAKSGENGDVRRCPSAQAKSKSASLTPAPFVTSGLVHPTSVAHGYLCP
ncbi:immunoglobulin superfamily DCC subclass member 4 isoform X4 [Vanacampus margaritifer]